MNNKLIPNIIFIILGIIIIAFPLTGILALNLVIAIPIMIMGLILFLVGLIGDRSIWKIILGILVIIFGILLLAYPTLFSTIIALIVALIGIILMFFALLAFIRRSERLNVIIASFVLGIIYFIIGYLLKDPNVLGVLIGLSLLIGGFLGILHESNEVIL